MNRPEPATANSRPQTPPALPSTRHRHRRWCLLIALAAINSALALAACGGPGRPATASSGKPATASSGSNSSGQTPGLAYSKCMRSHKVPNFPDPNVDSGYQVQVSGYHISVTIGSIPGINVQSPAFLAANLACQMLLPGGAQAPGQTHPTAAAMAKARAWAKCMRAHGVPNFPDPTTIMPSKPPSPGNVDSINGAVFLIPGSIEVWSPAFKQAAAGCGLPA